VPSLPQPACRQASRLAAGAALALVLLAGGSVLGGGVLAQAPRQSALGGAAQTRPHDSAQAALRGGNPQRALEISETALKAFPNDAQLRFTRALALNQLNRLAEAETAFMNLTQEFPELPEPYNNLAVVRAAQGKLDQARVALEDAIRAVPGYALAHENLGDIHAQLAARSYRRALELEPANRNIPPKLKLVSQVGDQPASAPSTRSAPGR
jgi:tetratricopeptide (TPR) repeat protein